MGHNWILARIEMYYCNAILLFAKPVSGLDSDAQAFITAAGITDSTQKTAINTLVSSLKSAGLWSKCYAIYPFVGGTATTHKWNLKDPRDLDAAYRLTFPNGATHSSTGVDWNGTNQYANTFFTPSTGGFTSTSAHLSYYSREDVTAAVQLEWGVIDGSSPFSQNAMALKYSGNLAAAIYGTNASATTASNTNSAGFFLFNRVAGNNEVYKGTTRILNVAQTAGVAPKPLYLGAENNNNTTAEGYTTKQCAFASIGATLTSTEESNYYSAVQAYQTTLSRQV